MSTGTTAFESAAGRVGLVLAVVGVWTVAVTAIPSSDAPRTWLLDITRYLTAELFVVAGVLQFAAWRSTRSAATLRSAIGLAAVGMIVPALAVLTPWAPDGLHISATAPAGRVLVFVPVLGLLALARPGRRRGAVGVARDRRPVPALPVLTVLVVPAIGLALLSTATQSFVAPGTVGTGLSAAGEVLLAAAWTALAIRTAAPRGIGWSTVAMLLMAGGELARALSLVIAGTTLGIAPGFALVAGVLFLYDAGLNLRQVHGAERAETRELSSALTRTRQLVERLEQGQRERLHDVRSAVVGVIGASRLLSGQQGPPDDDRAALQRLIAAELTRLQTVLDTDTAEPIVDFDLDDVLGPVLLAHRIGVGPGTLTTDLRPARCLGRPAATATVLDNLLGNVRTHAPAARVWVRVSTDADTVSVVVEDDGPGIPAAERADVLLPGIRGSAATAAGSGLGLANCVRAIGEQGGSLRLGARPGGGTRVTFTLPTAGRTLHALAS